MTLGPHERNQHSPHNFRWLPRHGEPLNIMEWLSQTFVRIVAWLPAYVAIVVTIMLLLQIFVLARLF